MHSKGFSPYVAANVSFGDLTPITGEQGRHNLEVYQAWQVINSAKGQYGDLGRLRALEFLNSEPARMPWFWLHWHRESLAKLEVPYAYLPIVNLQRAELRFANLQGADLRIANLQGADLILANLQGVDLRGANLQGADLSDANLKGADLTGANLQGANLKRTQMEHARYTDNSTSQEECKLFEKYPCPTIFPTNFNPKAAEMDLIN